jgi:hypothetical protein
MIISTALPNVAFSNPPSDSLVRKAISSVAWPIKNARGIIDIIENMKLIPGLCAMNEKYTVIGSASNSQFNLFSNGLKD